MRQLFILFHKYTGLTLGVLLAVTALSGSLLVFDRELDELLTPATADFEPVTELAPFQLALDNARAAVNNGSEPTRLMLGRHSGAPHIIRFPTPEDAAGPIEVSVHPGTGEALAVRIWGEYPVTWIYHLHLAFLAGPAGELVVGVMGFCLLFFCLTGVVIWWPKISQGQRQWRRAFTIRSRAGAFRLNYDLHKTTGVYLLPVFILLAVTGIEIVWHDPFETAVAAVLPVREDPDPVSQPGLGEISIDEAASIGQSVFPDSRMARLYLPANAEATWRVTFMHPEEWWNEYGASTVYIDQYDGEVLEVWDARDLPAGSTLLSWMFPLHNGDALGLPGRILVFLSGLLMTGLFVTGIYMWLKKRQPRTGRPETSAEQVLELRISSD
ncbi:MAG: PepSY-associated TM helix domain-containing protein [Pseudohongiellaceae bacterium]|jgi:uncharacterized iron-regulated membrane protein